MAEVPGEAVDRLLEAWRGEIVAGAVYQLIAERERDPKRAEILRRMAEAESGHRRRLEARMHELGIPVPDPGTVRISPWLRLQARFAPVTGCWWPPCSESSPASRAPPAARTSCSRPAWRARSPRRCRWPPARSWPSGRNSRSPRRTWSGNGRRSPTTPDEEREELSLFYQLKGLDEDAADALAAEQAKDPEALLRLLTAEELGGAKSAGDPVQASLAAGISTGVGAIIPVIPFFWMTGTAAIVIAGVVSLVAHFAVGAAKSLFTLRSWWASGLEMTLAGVIVGGATYAIGLAFS